MPLTRNSICYDVKSTNRIEIRVAITTSNGKRFQASTTIASAHDCMGDKFFLEYIISQN
jgi:hypothetical protein